MTRKEKMDKSLRQRATERLQDASGMDASLSAHDAQRLLQELKIHQIELEMQNEELQRAYTELEASRERYFDLYDLAPVCYATVSEAGLIMEANLTAATLLGMTRGALPGQPFGRFIFKEDSPLYSLHRQQLFMTGETQTCEVRIIKTDGATCWVQMVMSIAERSDSHECRVVFHDITGQKRAEELQEKNVELEDVIEKRTRELLKVQSQYQHAEKLAAIGRLSASIAHEFNNPLQSILTVLKGIERYAELKKEELEFVDMALKEGKRMRDLIISLQDFYRPSSGKFESVNLHELIDSLLIFTRKIFHSRRISIVLEYAEDVPPITAVADQLKQIFINLLNNAADACEDGGVITVATEVAGREHVVVHVRDNGRGIEPDHLGKIFDPFFTTKRKGTGLGLSVCYGIAKDHGGRIEVHSKRGQGTVFSVFLPREAHRREAGRPGEGQPA